MPTEQLYAATELTQPASTARVLRILPKLDAPLPKADNAIRPRSTHNEMAPSARG